MVRQWVLNPVSFPHADRLTVVWEIDTKKGWINQASTRTIPIGVTQNSVFENLAAWTTHKFNLTGKERPERILGARVSANFFQTLGAQPIMGRTFSPQEDQTGSGKVAILSYGLWHDRLNADPSEPGKTITLDGDSYTVIGVMPDDFHFTLMGRANIWVPLAPTDMERTDRVNGWLNVVGRLKARCAAIASAKSHGPDRAAPRETLSREEHQQRNLLEQPASRNRKTHRRSGHLYGFLHRHLHPADFLRQRCRNSPGRRFGPAERNGPANFSGSQPLGASCVSFSPRIFGSSSSPRFWESCWPSGAEKESPTSFPFQNRGYLPNYGRLYVDFSTLAYSVAIALFSALAFGLAPALHTSKPDLTGDVERRGQLRLGQFARSPNEKNSDRPGSLPRLDFPRACRTDGRVVEKYL